MRVEARAAMEQLTAGVHEGFARLAADLVDRLQTIRGETGRGDEDALDARARQALECLLGVRLQPLLASEKRLERLRPLVARPAEALDEPGRRALDVRGVGVALPRVGGGDAVEA